MNRLNIIIFDWKRTLYDPDEKILLDGAVELLEFLKAKDIPMILIGKGGEDMKQEVERLGVARFFQHIVFAEGLKDPELFKAYIDQDNSKSTLFIGDRVRSELEIGNKLGATTIWVKQGKFATEEPINGNQKPDYIVSFLGDCKRIILSLN